MGDDRKIKRIEMQSPATTTFKDIVLNQLSTLVKLSNVEFRGGYYSTTTSKSGDEKEIYNPDTREIFGNGTYIFAILLTHKFDNKMKPIMEAFNIEMDKIKTKFINASSVKETVVLGDVFYENTSDKILLETYKTEKLALHLNLFSELCKQLARLRFMEITGKTYE